MIDNTLIVITALVLIAVICNLWIVISGINTIESTLAKMGKAVEENDAKVQKISIYKKEPTTINDYKFISRDYNGAFNEAEVENITIDGCVNRMFDEHYDDFKRATKVRVIENIPRNGWDVHTSIELIVPDIKEG